MPLVAERAAYRETLDIDENDIRLPLLNGMGTLAVEGLSKNEKTKLQLLYNLETYILSEEEGLSSEQLRAHQQDVFHDVYDFIATPPKDETGQIINKGYIQMPTGTGKTAIFSALVNAVNKPTEEGMEKLKSLILVPRLDLVRQTIGTDGKRGFAQFGKDTLVTEFTGDRKDLTGEAVVMTYASLVNGYKSGAIQPGVFDLIICDEAHRVISSERQKALDHIAGQSTVIGLTATPAFSNRHVDSFFTEKIHQLDLSEAIKLGLLSPVEGFAIKSEEEITTLVPSGDFNEDELANLAESVWRNKKAIEFTKAFVEQGKQGLIACIPGEAVKHAKEMANLLNSTVVRDAYSGEDRNIVALSVSGSTEDREQIYNDYENGKIDVLTYVDILTEGWDSTKAKFLINLRPTTSPVNAVQRIGRILRKSDNPEDVATVVEFFDKTEKPIYTFFHAMGDKTIVQGKKHETDKGGDNEPGGGNPRGLDINELPEDIQKIINEIHHITVDSLAVAQGAILEAPEGYQTLNSIAVHYGINVKTLSRLLEANGIDAELLKYDGYPTYGLSAEAQEQIADLPELQITIAPEGYISLNGLAKQLKMQDKTLDGIIKTYVIPTEVHKFGRNTIGKSLSPDAVETIMNTPDIRTRADGSYISISAFAKSQGIDRETLTKLIEREGITPALLKIKGKEASTLSTEAQQQLISLPELNIPVPEEGYISIGKYRTEHALSHPRLIRVIEGLGIELKQYKFRKTAYGLSPEQQEQVLSEYRRIYKD